MKENWFAILMFSLIFGILGFLLGRTCCTCHGGCHGQRSQQCCAEGPSCHAGGENVFIKEIHGHGDHDKMEVIIHELEDSDWTGDTTIVLEGMTIKMNKSEDGEIDVQVEMEEGGEWVEETREAGEKVEKRVKIIKEEAEEHE
jgi:hypothetical protein